MARVNLTTFRLCAVFTCCKGSDRFGPEGRIPRGWRMHPDAGPLCPKHAHLAAVPMRETATRTGWFPVAP